MNFKSPEMLKQMLTKRQEEAVSEFVEIDSFYEYCAKDEAVIEYDENDRIQFIYLEDEENTTMK